MKRNKSTPQHEVIIKDDSSEPSDRINAAVCLASDGFADIIFPELIKWLNSSHFLLRSEAVWMLLSGFGHQKYVGKAFEMLHNDSNWSVKVYASNALTQFTQDYTEGEKYEDQIIKELLLSLLNDEDEFVQQCNYKNLHQLVKKEKPKDEKDSFNLMQDVDWQMLEPYLKKYDLQKPT